jgi:CHAT domain-containing protein/tetratricopeptide (TPR) repeat protein
MPAKAFALAFLLLCSALLTAATPVLSTADVKTLYRKADGYYNSNPPSPVTDSLALTLFQRLIDGVGDSAARSDAAVATILFNSYVKKGILLDVQASYAGALSAYTGALRCLHRFLPKQDSLGFAVYVYAGTDHYNLDDYDSANFFLDKAERLAGRFAGLAERDRLYNVLGALRYESGNYIQAREYFSRALEIVRAERPADRVSAMNFDNNIAGSQYKLGLYASALTLYDSLLRFGVSSSQLYFNIGKCYGGLGDQEKALGFFRRVDAGKLPGVYNEMAYAHLVRGQKDSALFYLDQWLDHVDRAQQSRTDSGINALYRSQVLVAKGATDAALLFLQQAISTFSGVFANPDVHSNPTSFTGSFGSYKLFDALSYKAHLLQGLYARGGGGNGAGGGREQDLQDALAAYKSAIGLFRYIEKTYTTDDAKIFLKTNNRDLYENAVVVCLELDRLHPGGGFLEQAFILAEKSKASIVSASLDQMASARMPGVDPKLLAQQRELKYKIARLELHSDPERGKNISPAMASEKAQDEIQLSFLQKTLEQNSGYYQMKFADTCPSVAELQGGLDDDQAIVSLFVSAKGLHVFLIGRHSFAYRLIDSKLLDGDVKEWIGLLNSTEKGQRFGNKALEASLVSLLVRPLLSALPGKTEWTVIPDGIFYQLPLESLPVDAHHHALIETVTISYQLSARFLSEAFRREHSDFAQYAVLSFAPFAGDISVTDTISLAGDSGNMRGDIGYMGSLPGSGKEIAGLPGRQFVNAQATKANFLQLINQYPVIHLATHAWSDPADSKGSRIFFYPGGAAAGGDSSGGRSFDDDNLYLPELYGLNMDSTELVILSACESGKGETVDNEGIISLSRGFMYAGCASTVNSLWKADDESTAFILSRFHVYLERGLSKSVALQKAKLDYIHSNAVYITPNYWAHLILIGNTEPVMRVGGQKKWILLCGGILVLMVVGGFIWRVRSGSRDRSSR